MDQRVVLLILAALIVLGIIWYTQQTPHVPSPTETPPPATTPTTPPTK